MMTDTPAEPIAQTTFPIRQIVFFPDFICHLALGQPESADRCVDPLRAGQRVLIMVNAGAFDGTIVEVREQGAVVSIVVGITGGEPPPRQIMIRLGVPERLGEEVDDDALWND